MSQDKDKDLELVAKAAGVIGEWGWENSDGVRLYKSTYYKHGRAWNPKKSDLDAFKLAIRLGISVVIVDGMVIASRWYADKQNLKAHSQKLDFNDTTAVREVIWEAALEIANQMEKELEALNL